MTKIIKHNEDIKKLQKIFDTLSDLYEDAVKVDNDCASAISTAEDTIAMTIKFLKKGKEDGAEEIHKQAVLDHQYENLKEDMQIGDRIKVIDQEIYGKIIHDYGTEVVIEDEDAETDDNTLCFKKSEVEEITK
tara:strand:+ start:47 stop:445 length:399 start_codon:yes stop_codon:yes gene_type:complete